MKKFSMMKNFPGNSLTSGPVHRTGETVVCQKVLETCRRVNGDKSENHTWKMFTEINFHCRTVTLRLTATLAFENPDKELPHFLRLLK